MTNERYNELLAAADAADACSMALSVLRGLTPDEALAHENAPAWAYWYARRVIGGRWSEGEFVIARDARWAYWYARYVVEGPWAEGEPVIAQDAEWAYQYTRYVVGGPWSVGESAIAQDAQ